MTGRAGPRPGYQRGMDNGQTVARFDRPTAPRQQVDAAAEDLARVRELAASLRAEVEAKAEARQRARSDRARRDFRGGPVRWSP